MKKKYSIGLIATILISFFLIGAVWQLHAPFARTEQLPAEGAVLQAEELLTAEGEAEEREGYYLCELQGYVVVYLSDRKTIYEMTEIAVSSLPKEVQGEIREGKFISKIEELYGFLENYSS